ncbi:hypothetical protein ARAM_000583 [Aspergillus rambellii]|uniref:RRM domain-containing protein n=1 Tax=Aspergillus rambellii TaxID=308745 RepID=A0A0F8USA4_9EURO|nr:hypothetical protein ARAM_000583 [Aspergillus rambellii]
MSGSSNQSTRTSPGSYSTTHRTPSVSSGASPPQQSLSSSQAPATAQNAMSTDVYNPPVSQVSTSLSPTFSYPFSPLGTAASFDNVSPATMRMGDSDRSAQSLNSFMRPASGANGGAILMRRLPKNMSREALRSMFLFSKDLLDADFVPNDFPEDNGFLSAIARFCTMAGAEEARALLDGKPNSKNDATMIVEIYNPSTPGALFFLGATPSTIPRRAASLAALEKLTAANPTGSAASDALPSSSESGSRIHNIFSPQSPIGNGVHELPRISGKSMIDQDIDEDTGELLKDPVGYAENGHSGPGSAPRRSTNPHIPTSHFANLSLSTNLPTSPMQNYTPGGSAHLGADPILRIPPTD